MMRSRIFSKPVAVLPVSEDFKEAMKKEDIKTLEEIIDIPIAELVNYRWFTKEVLEELEDLLF
ncbi:MAG: hypothetical protein V4539_08275 [Bacteroidota bacterium]